MLPEGFKRRIDNQKYIDSEALLKALEQPSPVSIRINREKWNKSPERSHPVSWCQSGYYLDNRPSYTLDPLFHSGCYYPQEASSMFLEQAIRQSADSLDNIRVLDLCGAPGGKSTHIAEILGENSFLVANEVIRSRSLILAENLTKWGKGNTLVTQNDPLRFGSLPGFFDIIVVDAPCSGEGMFRTEVALSEWSVENTAHCSERQKRIVMDVWPALKENGLLVYSTCTFNPGENEENIKWLIDKNEAESVCLKVDDFSGITVIDNEGVHGYGFYPDKVKGEGFFISVIRKRGKQESKSMRRRKIDELQPSKKDLEVVRTWTDFNSSRILNWSEELFAIPCPIEDYITIFNNFNVVKKGTNIALVKQNSYLPSHDLSLSVHLKPDSMYGAVVDYATALQYLRRDTLVINDAPMGWIVIKYGEVNLGFVKNLGHRVNNYFPVEWRIRMSIPKDTSHALIEWKNDIFTSD